MRGRFRALRPVIRLVLAGAIVIAVGRRFAHDLAGHPELWQRSLQPGWLVIAALLYLIGLGFSAGYWDHLLHLLGQRPGPWTTLQAYFVGHMGKYLPGKALALFLRADLTRGPQVRPGLAGLTAFYEVLVTMASGALLAAVLFSLLLPPSDSPWSRTADLILLRQDEMPVLDRPLCVGAAVFLFLPLAVPVLPPVFNRLAHGVSLPFRRRDTPVPRLPLAALPQGLVMTAPGWAFLGLSLVVVLRTVGPESLAWDLGRFGRVTSILAVAYVAGFVVLLAPAGLGVREYLLEILLVAEFGPRAGADLGADRAAVVFSIVVLRTVWTAAEVLMCAVAWWLARSLTARRVEDAA